MFYEKLIKPFLFLLDAENAHELSSQVLQLSQYLPTYYRPFFRHSSHRLQNRLANIDFSGPVGMAAGFDKTGQLYPILANIGFDFIECGTFTALQQDGNSKPRLFRLPEHQALINRMGFNNPGAQAAAQTFSQQKRTVPRGINIGKSKATHLEEATEDYILTLRELAPFADYITINVSSPNTQGLRQLQAATALRRLLQAIQHELQNMQQQGARLPLLVKLAPDLSFRELDEILEVLVDTKAAGVILTNTSLDQSLIDESQKQTGGLSGTPIKDKSTTLIRHTFRQAGQELFIIGVGGISNGATALEKILAGASLIQVYTGYVYKGPFLPLEIQRHIDRFLQKESAKIQEIIGADTLAPLNF